MSRLEADSLQTASVLLIRVCLADGSDFQSLERKISSDRFIELFGRSTCVSLDACLKQKYTADGFYPESAQNISKLYGNLCHCCAHTKYSSKRGQTMSRGSLVIIGLFSALLSGVLALVTVVSGDSTPMGYFGGFVLSAFFACVTAACLFESGRWITTRITAAGIALVVAITIITGLSSAEEMPRRIGKVVAFGLMGAACGYYAVTGKYPDDMPMSEFFAQPAQQSQKKRRKKKRPQRKRSYDYE